MIRLVSLVSVLDILSLCLTAQQASWTDVLEKSVLEVEACNLKFENCVYCVGVKLHNTSIIVIPLECLKPSSLGQGSTPDFTDRIRFHCEGEWWDLEISDVDTLSQSAYLAIIDSTARELKRFRNLGLHIADSTHLALSRSKLMLWRHGSNGLNARKFDFISPRSIQNDTTCVSNVGTSTLWLRTAKADFVTSSLSGCPLFTRSFSSDSIFFVGYYVGNIGGSSLGSIFRNLSRDALPPCGQLDSLFTGFTLAVRREDHFSKSMNLIYSAMQVNTTFSKWNKTVFRKKKITVLEKMFASQRRDYPIIVNYDVSEGNHESVEEALESRQRDLRCVAAFSLLLRRLYIDHPCIDLTDSQKQALRVLQELTSEKRKAYRRGFYERIGIGIYEIKAILRLMTLHEEARVFLEESKEKIRKGDIDDFIITAEDLIVETEIYSRYYADIVKNESTSALMLNHAHRQVAFLSKVNETLEDFVNRKREYCAQIEDSLCVLIQENPCQFIDITRTFNYAYNGVDCAICDNVLDNVTSWEYDFGDCESEFKFEIVEGIEEKVNRMIKEKFSIMNQIGGVIYQISSGEDKVSIDFEISAKNRFLQTYAQLSEYPLAIYRNVYTIRFDSCLVNFLLEIGSDTTLNQGAMYLEFYGSADGVPYRGDIKYEESHYGRLESIIPDKFPFLKNGSYGLIKNTPAYLMSNNQKLAYLRSYEHFFNLKDYISMSSDLRIEQVCEVFSQKDDTKRKSEVRVILDLVSGPHVAPKINDLMEGGYDQESSQTSPVDYQEPETLHKGVMDFLSHLDCGVQLLGLSRAVRPCLN